MEILIIVGTIKTNFGIGMGPHASICADKLYQLTKKVQDVGIETISAFFISYND